MHDNTDRTTSFKTPANPLTAEQLAAILQISVETVGRLRRARIIPARVLGGVYRFLWDEVEAALPSTAPELLKHIDGA